MSSYLNKQMFFLSFFLIWLFWQLASTSCTVPALQREKKDYRRGKEGALLGGRGVGGASMTTAKERGSPPFYSFYGVECFNNLNQLQPAVTLYSGVYCIDNWRFVWTYCTVHYKYYCIHIAEYKNAGSKIMVYWVLTKTIVKTKNRWHNGRQKDFSSFIWDNKGLVFLRAKPRSEFSGGCLRQFCSFRRGDSKNIKNTNASFFKLHVAQSCTMYVFFLIQILKKWRFLYYVSTDGKWCNCKGYRVSSVIFKLGF